MFKTLKNKNGFIFKSQMIITLSTALLLNGCARNISPHAYSDTTVGEATRTFRGTIVSVRTVQVGPEQLENNLVGAGIGGVAGGLLGNQLGKGKGNIATTAGGAILGALAGSYAEKELKTQDAFEYVVELQNGEMRTVVQGMDVRFNPGQRVLLMVAQRGRSRIVADAGGY
jgi:outer membrane lipoprotein SlyB